METYYLVKTVSRATENNINFKDHVHTYMNGKADELLYAETEDHWIDRNCIFPTSVREYGYRRKSDARRCYSYTHPENSSSWTSEVSIVAVHILPDNSIEMEG